MQIPVRNVNVNLVRDPTWSPGKITDEAKQQLGMK